MDSKSLIEMTERYSAHNYSPIDVVITEGDGVWVTDLQGKRYLDMLSAYSALSFGHRHPRIIAAAKKQLDRITLTSRAFYNDELAFFCKELAELCGMHAVLPMNSGAEAVEIAIKTARKWGHNVKGIPAESAEIITFAGNFHGRTTTIISFSSSTLSKSGFGPFTPGFVSIPFGDLAALRGAITARTAGVLIEPIQGEGGIIIPPDGFLRQVRELCNAERVLMVADEIQTGLCRTGKLFACDHEDVRPDMYILGKALAGGITPLSAIAGTEEVMSVLTPGTHGSTFGGNPLACAIAREVMALIRDERPEDKAREMGKYLLGRLHAMKSTKVEAVRGRGLLIGIDIKREAGSASQYCHELVEHGVLCKDTRAQTIRIAPPLFISKRDVDWGLERIEQVLG